MADDQRVYSDEEFALILRKAAELTRQSDSPTASAGGFTLTEMKSAAAQAGLDPALVERAARLLGTAVTASPLERLTGGPLRHSQDAHFSTKLDEHGAARLLSAIRIAAGLPGSRDVGHSSEMGVAWHDGGELESLGITARPDENGTTVTIALDRRGTLGIVSMVSGISIFLLFLFSVFGLYPEAPALGIGGIIVGIGGSLAAARAYWASSTKKVRERINVVMDAIGETLSQRETHVSVPPKVEDGITVPEPDAADSRSK